MIFNNRMGGIMIRLVKKSDIDDLAVIYKDLYDNVVFISYIISNITKKIKSGEVKVETIINGQ